MTERVHIGRFGGEAHFRISKPGKSAGSTNFDDFVIREDADTFKPLISGSHAFSAGGSASFTIPALAYEPFVVLKSSDSSGASQGNYYATLDPARTTLTLQNAQNIARTIYYYVLQS